MESKQSFRRAADAGGRGCLALARAVVALVLVATPLLWGGRHAFAIGLFGIALIAALLLWALGNFLRGSTRLESVWGLVLFGPGLVIGFLQLCPAVFERFAPEGLRSLWEHAAEVADLPAPVLAVTPGYHTEILMALCGAALLYFLLRQLFNRTDRCLALAAVLFLSAVVTAVAGLVAHFGGLDWFFWLYKGADRGFASAGFLNRNHFAGLCAMGFFVGMGLLAGILLAKEGSGIERITRRHKRLWSAVLFAGIVATGLGVVFSFSRAGTLSWLAGFILLAGLLTLTRGHRSAALPVLVGCGVLLVGSFYGFDLVLRRLEFALSGTDPSGLVRIEIWRVMTGVIGISPWLGSGFGAARGLSPTFDTSFMPGHITNDAHNDYIDLMAMLGIPAGAFILVLGFGIFLFLWVRLLTSRRRHWSSYFPLALSLGVGLAVALAHEVVEYGLKQSANFFFFTATAVLFAFFVKRLNAGERRHRTEAVERRFLAVGFQGAVTLLLAAGGVCALPTYVHEAQAGLELAELEGLIRAKETNRAMDRSMVNRQILAKTEKVLAIDPKNERALEIRVDVFMDEAGMSRQAAQAESISRILGREVSTRQMGRRMYETYQQSAIERIPAEDRQRISGFLHEAADAAGELSSLTPSNALSVSMKAAALEEAAFWEGKTPEAMALHDYALSLYPAHALVLSRAVRGEALHLAYETNEDALGKERLEATAKRLCAQRPNELSWVLPLVDAVTAGQGNLEALVPGESIRGQELLARYQSQKGWIDEALSALVRMETLNDARLDEDLSGAAFLFRERRSQTAIAKIIEDMRSGLYARQGDEEARAAAEKRSEMLELEANTERLARADELMARGEWIIAEEVLKKMPHDPRSLVRQAEIALVMSRDARTGQLVRELEAMEGSMDQETLSRYEKVKATFHSPQ